MEINPQAFKEFEHLRWELAAEAYHSYFEALTSQMAEPLLDAVCGTPRMTLLDLACGPGCVSAAALKRGARVTGVDFSEVMVSKAKRLVSGATFVIGDAEGLSLSSNSFGAVTMNFGILHLARPECAIGEALRVLEQGGRFAFTAWGNRNDSVAFGIVLSALELFGNSRVPLPDGPPFFRFSDAEEARMLLASAGFVDIRVRFVTCHWRLNSAEDFFEAFRQGTARTGGLLSAQTMESLEAIKACVLEKLQPYGKSNGIEIPMKVMLASGRKP